MSQELRTSKKELVSVRQDLRRISQHISKLRNEIRRLKNKSSGSNLRRRGHAPTFKFARLAYPDLVEALTMFRWAVLDRQLSASVSEKELKSMCQKIKRATACLRIYMRPPWQGNQAKWTQPLDHKRLWERCEWIH